LELYRKGEFSTSQSFAYLTNSQYVFAGDSSAQMTMSAGGTVPSMGTVYANDTFIGNDSTFSGNPVSLSSANTPVLLAALTLNAAITSPGDSYSIKLVPGSGNGSMSSSMQTFFDVVDFANTGLETSAVPLTSVSGTVLIGRASVPEPGSLVSGLIGMITLAGFCGVRRLHRLKVSWGSRRQATAMSPAPRAAARLA